ncbi:MAG TPA: DUF2795 domain-containing protein [Ktedonobacteraceae bacterium]|nr:DUF2795 domain-containing protein [Ktedonobacteraceae bacterium]
MNFDAKLLNQLLSTLRFPVSRDDLLEVARQSGLDDMAISDLEALLPDKTFNSANEILDFIPNWEE